MSKGATQSVHALEATAAAQQSLYEAQGYLVFPRLLDPAELAELREALVELLRRVAEQTEPDEQFQTAPDADGRQHLIRVFDPIACHKAFYDLVFNTKIVDVVENLIGPNIQLRHTALHLKSPSKYSAWLWHQDYPFFPHTNYDLLAVMIFLDDATTENGCLTVLPGSHKNGPRDHEIRSGEAWRLMDRTGLADRSRWLALPVPAGGMELHHCNLLHGSRAGRSDDPRSAIVIWYRAADNIQLAGSTNHSGYGLQIRGVNPGVVRMVQQVVKLPDRVGDGAHPNGK